MSELIKVTFTVWDFNMLYSLIKTAPITNIPTFLCPVLLNYYQKQTGHKHVELSDVFKALRSRGDKVKPTIHAILVGVASVILPFK